MILKIILAVLAGYLLGSISPAYILGKLLRGIDIREYGDKNAGTTNTRRVLGLGPAIITGFYDFFKIGIFAVVDSYI